MAGGRIWDKWERIVPHWTFCHISNEKMEGFNNKIRWLIKQTLRLQRSWVLQIENLSAAGNFRLKGDMSLCHKTSKRLLWSTLCLARLWRVKHTKVWSGTLCHEAHLPPLLKLWRDKSVHEAKSDGFMFFLPWNQGKKNGRDTEIWTPDLLTPSQTR